MTGEYDAIVLAGGRASRMAGAAKPQLSVGAATMLNRVLAAVSGAGTRIVVGPEQPVPAGVLLVQETPVGSGPVAGLAAGLTRSSAAVVLVLAADLPYLTPEVIEALIHGLGDEDDVAFVVDENGKDQFMLGAWRAGPLRRALADLAPLPDRAMKDLVRDLRVSRVVVVPPDDAPAPWADVDTPDDLDRARRAFPPPG